MGTDSKPWQFKPGAPSANPAGRPKGSRNKLGEAFVEALHADFMANGAEAIEKCRETKPEVYLSVIAKVLPKTLDVNVTHSFLDYLKALNGTGPGRSVQPPKVEEQPGELRH